MRFNQVAIAGRLTRDPEMKTSAGGTVVCKFSLAFDQGTGDSKRAGFIEVSCFGKTAETATKYLKKGSAVLVGGRIEHQTWEGENGGKRSGIKIVGHDIQFLDKKKDAEDAPEEKASERSSSW